MHTLESEIVRIQTKVGMLEGYYKEFKENKERDDLQRNEVLHMMTELLDKFGEMQKDITETKAKVNKIIDVDRNRKNIVVGFMAAFGIIGGVIIWSYDVIIYKILDIFEIPHKK